MLHARDERIDTVTAFGTSGPSVSLAFPYTLFILNGTLPARLLAFAPVAALDGAAYSGDTLFVPSSGSASVTVASVAPAAPTPVPALTPLLLGLLALTLAAASALAMRR